MYCPNCGTSIPEGGSHCPACGTSVQAPELENPQGLISTFPKKEAPAKPAYTPTPAPAAYTPAPAPVPAPVYTPDPAPIAASPAYTPVSAPTTVVVPSSSGDDPRTFFARYPEYKLMSAWGYFGLGILYSLPIIGFIFLIIHSCNGSNLNRRSYARSYWIIWLILAIAAGIGAALIFAFGMTIFGISS
ncbi:MAG: zinc ribbon domain-containing protein [Clostridia bacterium]|nr:zinc ribbon domain-containing protein [Clostridia bacterium]